LGNYLFGLILETLRKSTALDSNIVLYSKRDFFDAAADQFGPYKNKSNGTDGNYLSN
jgi:hypothetical protein